MLIHYEGGLHMTKYREILRLTALGLSLRVKCYTNVVTVVANKI